MKTSIIIPTYQEVSIIGKSLKHLKKVSEGMDYEIIVVDGGSDDGTIDVINSFDVTLLKCPKKGRACQMNYGAKHASGEILYFLHADAFPPSTFLQTIETAIGHGFDFGHFRQRILSENKLVKLNSFFSRLPGLIGSGGDQSLFIRKPFFDELRGYNEQLALMEDYDFVKRARKKGNWVKVPIALQVADRKYNYNSFVRVNASNVLIYGAYRLGVSPDRLKRWYSCLIKGPRYKDLK